MKISETTHHGSFYHQRTVDLPDQPSVEDVAAMLASGPYAYHDVAPERLARVHADLTAGREAEHGWTRWIQSNGRHVQVRTATAYVVVDEDGVEVLTTLDSAEANRVAGIQ